jgi:gliding motility-associated-like protein
VASALYTLFRAPLSNPTNETNNGTQNNFLNLASGTYIIGIRDNNGCVDTIIRTINPGINCCNLNFQSIAITQPTCAQSNGSISLTMTGGTLPYSYTWSPNVSITNVASNLAPNTYNVTVNAGVGCSRDTVITLNSNSNLAINISNVVNPTCVGSNGSLTAGFSGGTAPYTVTIDTGGTPIVFSGIPFPVSQPVNGLPADTIRIRVTDGQNCEANQIVVLTSPSPPTINNIQVVNEQCLNAADGQLIAANATGGSGGGYTYSYSPSANPTNTTPIVSFPVANLAAGSYILTVVDGAGCRDTAWFSIVAGPLCCNLTLSAALTQPDCGINNGAINVTVTQGSGNYTYAWQPGGQSTQDVSNLSAGNYNLTLTDVTQGCSIDTIFSLSNPNAPTINNVQVTNERCTGDNNGSITVTASGGTGQLNYTWSPSLPNSASQSNLSPGPYSFTITDANNCVVTGSRTILAGTRPDASGVVTNPSCNNNDGQITISVLPIGSYQYVLSNGAQNGSGQFSSLPQGSYQVFVIDGNGCRDTVGLNLVASGPILSTISSQNVSCFGANDGSIVLNNVLPNYQYSWSIQGLQGSSLSGLASNTYSVTITDGLGCSLVLSTVISSPSPVIVSLGQDTVICGTSFRINAGNPGLTFAWSTNEQVQEITIINSGTYTVTVSDANGCSAVNSINVQIFPPVSINLRRDTTIFSGESVLLTSIVNGGSGVGNYVWTPTEFLSCSNCQTPISTPNDTIAYFVRYIDSLGCVATDLINIYIDEEFAFYYPNAFTPNGDSNNDIYIVFGRGVETVRFSIFNRWGEKVFESTSMTQGWDGKYKGEMQPPGVYVLSATATFFNGQTIRRMGSVTLIH